MSTSTYISDTPPPLLLETLFPAHNSIPTGLSLYKGDDSDVESIPTPTSRYPSRPYVTLTFAQSVDAKIAGKGGQQLILSGKESMVMTHWCVYLVTWRPLDPRDRYAKLG
jgi:2,5-diamino-6-(ribosylamino)-4(3H)-pyrimidinone 5'-phosphate reductase